ncbi:MAG TPA: hypothetical protein VMB34_32105 [Acetobacteraceae bacterium]|nr:hypothetical protein [Acetobacteraceae bacterium]
MAEKVASAAMELHDPQLRLSMLAIAAAYDALASHAERRTQVNVADPVKPESSYPDA